MIENLSGVEYWVFSSDIELIGSSSSYKLSSDIVERLEASDGPQDYKMIVEGVQYDIVCTMTGMGPNQN